MVSTDLYNVIKQVCEEKQISEDSVISTLELALAAAYRKDFADKLQNIKVKLDPKTGQFKVFDVKKVVEDVSKKLQKEAIKLAKQKKKATLYTEDDYKEDEDKQAGVDIDLSNEDELIEQGKALLKFNPRTEIQISDAKKKQKGIKIDSILEQELEVPEEFGRMAAQTAKQVIIQRIREAERETIFNEYKNREREMLSGAVQRVEGPVVMIDIGRTNAILPPREQSPNDNYRIGQRLKVLILSVDITPKGPEIIVSRTHKDLIKALFSLEVPEIESGAVEIKAVAREAGSRSKIAVTAHEEGIDPIGSCVGQRGSRVTAVIDELGGEKLDIIEWDDNSERFIASSLSPAKVEAVEIVNIDEKRAEVSVKSDQQSLAIGKGGQNVRLAAKLTGWKIDIMEAESGKAVGTSEGKKRQKKEKDNEKKSEKLKKTAKKAETKD